MQSLTFLFSADPEIIGVPKFKSKSRDLGHDPFWPNSFGPIFFNFCLVSLTFNLHAKFDVSIFSVSGDNKGCQNLKVGHVNLATPLWAYFLIIV